MIRITVIAALLIVGFAAMHYFAPLESCSVVFDLSLVVGFIGLIAILKPLHFLGIHDRRSGLALLAAAIVCAIVALNWPAPLVRTAGEKTKLDEFMPAWHVSEFHSVRVHAAPDRVWDATKRVKFSEVPAFAALMRVRMMAVGHFRGVQAFDAPILDVMTGPRSNFLPLTREEGHELVLGLAGKFWGNRAAAKITSPQEFLDYRQPGCAKAAFNFRVEDLGNGWSRVSTETRGIGVDEEGRRVFARYWRVIYPGSGAIRRMWLNAIKNRAERDVT